MTLDEAIDHAQCVAANTPSQQCSLEHEQLADWLRELKDLREQCKRWEDAWNAITKIAAVSSLQYTTVRNLDPRNKEKG